MMNDFAKLYESELYGQILVTLDENDSSEPELKISFKPDGLGVCKATISGEHKNTDEAWGKVEAIFDAVNQEKAELFVQELLKKMGLDALHNSSNDDIGT